MTVAEENNTWLMTAFQYDDGTGKIFRVRKTPPSDACEQTLSTCVVVEWPLDGDMPSKELMAHINTFEDALESLNSENGESVQFHIITGGGIREYCYYTTSYEWFINEFSELLSQLPRYPVNIEYQENTDWRYWRKILELAESEE